MIIYVMHSQPWKLSRCTLHQSQRERFIEITYIKYLKQFEAHSAMLVLHSVAITTLCNTPEAILNEVSTIDHKHTFPTRIQALFCP